MADLSALSERYLAAQLAGDRKEALRLVIEEGVERGVSVPDLQLDVVQSAQYEIGRLWQENMISIAQEHLATGISQLVLAHLYEYLPRQEAIGPRALVACVLGELHDMGARIAADHFEIRGYDVRFLGASVPRESLVQMVKKERPDVVALSASMTKHLVAARDTVGDLCALGHRGLSIAVGGRAFDGIEGFENTVGNVVSCGSIVEAFDKLPRGMGRQDAA